MDPLAIILDWIEGVLDATDPDNPDSHYNDHARECAEAIAFDTRRDAVREAILQLKGEG